MKEIEIIKATSVEDCDICDKFLEKLIKYESKYDNATNSKISISGCYENNLKHDFVYLAYAKATKPAGYIFAYLKNPKGKIDNTNLIQIEALYIDEKYRHKGIGKKLMTSCENWAKETFNNDYIFEVTHYNQNSHAQHLYESLGFRPIKTILRK